MKDKAIQTSAESGHQISADYRRHFEEMRDSSVATSPAQRCPFLSSISFGQRKRNGQTGLKRCETPFVYCMTPCETGLKRCGAPFKNAHDGHSYFNNSSAALANSPSKSASFGNDVIFSTK